VEDNDKLTDELKELILDLYGSGVRKPKAIIKAMEKKLGNNNAPKKNQIVNFITGHKRRKFGDGIELGDLSQWCLDHSEVPKDEDQYFVVHYQIFYDDEAESYDNEDDDYEPGDIFRVYISTKRLIRLSM
jgi:hypothetical protein